MFVHHNTEAPAQAAEQAGARNRTAVGGRTMISDMSWLISAWKAKVSTSSSAIVLVLVLGSYGRDYEGSRGGCVLRRRATKPSESEVARSFQKLKADLDMATAALLG